VQTSNDFLKGYVAVAAKIMCKKEEPHLILLWLALKA